MDVENHRTSEHHYLECLLQISVSLVFFFPPRWAQYSASLPDTALFPLPEIQNLKNSRGI